MQITLVFPAGFQAISVYNEDPFPATKVAPDQRTRLTAVLRFQGFLTTFRAHSQLRDRHEFELIAENLYV